MQVNRAIINKVLKLNNLDKKLEDVKKQKKRIGDLFEYNVNIDINDCIQELLACGITVDIVTARKKDRIKCLTIHCLVCFIRDIWPKFIAANSPYRIPS